MPVDPSGPVQPPVLTEADALDLLIHGELELEGRLVDASNTTLRAVIAADGASARCVYKPVHGERPLWDFPDGTLAGREVSAYLLSASAGFDVVPPTVLRDGPLGPGMCQLWIDEQRQSDDPLLGFVPQRQVPPGWRRVTAARDERGRPYVLVHADDPRLARMAVFDAVANNADRKGGHIIPTVDGRVYGVDHGICFHAEDKLRTVLWGFSADPLSGESVALLEKVRADLDGPLGAALAEHLTEMERGALAMRVGRLLATGWYPQPNEDWPSIPWPPV